MRNLTLCERMTLAAHLRGPQGVKAAELERLRRLAALGLISLMPANRLRPKFSRVTAAGARRLARVQAKDGSVLRLLAQ